VSRSPSPPKVLAVASQKGGAGKTTLATNLADALTLAGEAVLLIDLDPQRSALLWSETPSAVQVVAASAPALSPTPFARLASAYAWVIIDCPPRLDDRTLAAVAVASLVLVPIRPTSMDLAVLPATLRAIEHARLARAVITQRPPRSVVADSAPAAIRAMGLDVFTSTIAFRQDYPDAHSVGQSAPRHAPKSKAAAEIKALLKEIRTLLGNPQ
jgi:chromosome partitioning protein